MDTASFTEYDGDMIRTFRYRPETSVEFKTERQDVKILDTVLFGKSLFLDGVHQSSLKDEEIYHRKLVHPAFGCRRWAKTVCILGGGEGATAREVLKYPNVESITMIDWDQELVEYFRDKETSWHKGALTNPKVKCEFSDIFTLLDEGRQYDIIIVDLVDPDMKNEQWQTLFQKLVNWLSPLGCIVVNAGVVFPWDTGATELILECLKKAAGEICNESMKYKAFVPSFGQEWGFVLFELV